MPESSNITTPFPIGKFARALLLAPILFALGCDSSPDATDPPPTLTILQTGRLRGNIYPEGVQQGTAPLQYHPIIAGYVKAARQKAERDGTELLLIDLGDSLTGSFASHVTGSENVVRFFNALQYDAIALGNLDADLDPSVLEKLEMPVANPFITEDGQPAMAGTAALIEPRNQNIPVELLANFYGDADPDDHPGRFPVTFGKTENVQPVRVYPAPTDPNRLRLLTWMKFESPREPPKDYLEDLRNLGVDAVLAHRVYSSKERDAWSKEDPYIQWSPPVAQNILRDNRGFALSRLDLLKEGDQWKVLNHELVPMVANTAKPDREIEETLAPMAEKINAADETLTNLEATVDREAILQCYMQALSRLPEVDAVLYSPESIRGEWGRGPLRASRVFDSLPWSSRVVIMEVAPGDFDTLLEEGEFALLTRKEIPQDRPIRVATSQFFAGLLGERLGFDARQLTPVSDEPEFLWLNRHLKQHGVKAPMPEGWIYAMGR